jgi:cardiolipin synthase A/B
MKVMVQPGDGIALLLSGIKSAKKSIEIVIFRLDQSELEASLEAAVARGLAVQALIAYTNRAGEKSLRKLELRLLAAGVTVSRTADDLVRYHDKLMIIDRSTLYLMAFNLTYADINRSRSFGVVTKDRRFVQEAVKLFEADTARQPHTAGLDSFIVSPINARKQLVDFLSGARKQLLIYDNQIADMQMIRLLQSRAKAGVEIKIIG